MNLVVWIIFMIRSCLVLLNSITFFNLVWFDLEVIVNGFGVER